VEQPCALVRELDRALLAAEEYVALAAELAEPAALAEITDDLAQIERRLRAAEMSRLLSGPADHGNALVSLHPGAGGAEARDWTAMVLRMYLRWCARRGFHVEILDQQDGEDVGIEAVTFAVAGFGAYGYLRRETGVHRLVRMSPFGQGSRQTSFAGVEVLPDREDAIAVVVKEADLDWVALTRGGPGGQHQNKVASAVRLRHVPSGIAVLCRTERSQHQNRATALRMLTAKLLEREEKARSAAAVAHAKAKPSIGFGHALRSYVLAPGRRIVDARTGVESTNPEAVLDGEIDPFLEAAMTAE
jgi:peptide chain release factor 2